jgi:hypothetical protein
MQTPDVAPAVLVSQGRLCRKCRRTPVGPTQRWCSPCKRAQEHRNVPEQAGTTSGRHSEAKEALGETLGAASVAKKAPLQAEALRNTPGDAKGKGNTRGNELVPYVPFLDGAPDHLEPWYQPFLVALAKFGRVTLASATAQIHRRVAYAHMAKNPALSEEVDAAKAHYRSGLEYGLAHQFHVGGNVLAGFGALRAEMPLRYIEKSAVLSVTAPADLDSVDAREVLRTMLGSMRPSTQALLGGDGAVVIDGRALPEGAPPR